jgi:hypothetical protein
MASQIKANQVPPKYSCLHLLFKEFKTKWNAVKEAGSSNEEARSSNEEARSSKVVARSSEMEAGSNLEENAAALGVLNFDGMTNDDDIRPNLKNNNQKHWLIMLDQREHPMPKGWKGKMRLIVGTFASWWPQVSDTAVKQLLAAGGIQLASQTKLLDFLVAPFLNLMT